MAQQNGLIFNIQKFSVHDGHGIRTLVFFKGCPLRCRWCSNPESQKAVPEHAFNPMRCITAEVCSRCSKACPTGAISVKNNMICFQAARCSQCFACVQACPSGAQSVYGESMKVDDILNKVEEDGVFYNRSHGGLTLSGGEPLQQFEFAETLLQEAKHRHINTTIETCGCYPYERIQRAAKYLDKVIFDLKCYNNDLHKKHTGADNAIIMENFQRLCNDFPNLPIRARTPIIPGFNDNVEEIRALRNFIPKRPNIEYELLAYHRMGQPKYGYIGRKYELEDASLDEDLFHELQKLAL